MAGLYSRYLYPSLSRGGPCACSDDASRTGGRLAKVVQLPITREWELVMEGSRAQVIIILTITAIVMLFALGTLSYDIMTGLSPDTDSGSYPPG